AITAVADAPGPIDAVVAHSAGCGMAVAAIGEGWMVKRGALIAPPLRESDRWRRYADKLAVSEEIALAAKAAYFRAGGQIPCVVESAQSVSRARPGVARRALPRR